MSRFLKLKLVILVSSVAFFSQAALAMSASNDQGVWDGNPNVVELSNAQSSASAKDPVLAAISQAKTTVNENKKNVVKISNVKPQPKATIKKVATPSWKTTYKVHNVAKAKSKKKMVSHHELFKTYGPTKRSEHLWQIARQVRPAAKCTLAQTAVAIFNANPRAFNGNNINGLRHGKVLKIPGKDKVLSMSENRASRIIMAQNRAWANMKRGGKVTVAANKKMSFRSHVSSKVYVAKVKRIVSKVKMPVAVKENQTKVAAIKLQPVVKQVEPKAISTIVTAGKNVATNDNGELNNRVSKLEHDTSMLQQNVTQRINNLNDRNLELQGKIITLERGFTVLGGEVNKLQKNEGQAGSKVCCLGTIFHNLNKYFLDHLGRGLYIGIVLLVLLWLVSILVWVVWPKGKGRIKKYVANENYEMPEGAESDAEEISSVHKEVEAPDIGADEYDFLSGPEGNTSKLDLARVYIDMGDKDRAHELLKEVLEEGDEDQRADAQDLLNKTV